MPVQWLACVLVAAFVPPMARAEYVGVPAAVILGGLTTVVPLLVARRSRCTPLSRHAIAVGQMLTSALLIHIAGGRIEAHFHVFVSLAILALYRDWKVIATACCVVGVDHLVRGTFWPESVFGVAAAPWRWLEHAAWVGLAGASLGWSCLRSREWTSGTTRCLDCEANGRLSMAIGERVNAEEERDRLSRELLSAQKLEAIGQLAAGIAHEINTPTQYVGDNTRFLQDSFAELAPILTKARALAGAVGEGAECSELAAETRAALEEADVEYLAEEIPRAIEQSLDGIARVSKIVRAMKEFSHPGVEGMTEVDLNHAIESTITVARNEWKYLAEVETDFDPELGLVPCIPGELNQVFLNLLVNAAHAIGDVVGDGGNGKGTIVIRTRLDGEHAEVRISDTGTGIPEDARGKIFDPFFTTKEVGKGTGQGLSIAHAVVVQKHSGTLDFQTELGVGTTFVVRLPLVQKEFEATEQAA